MDPYDHDAELRKALRGLHDPEATYYRNIDRWANLDFDDTPRSLLDTLVRESKKLSRSKVHFPQNDDRLIRSLRENMAMEEGYLGGKEPTTFGNVAASMRAFFLIDIEDGHYRSGADPRGED